jgi:hypothetical protein
MHRSGTSFITRLLQRGGLYLGEARSLLPPGPDNPDGYFEHRGLSAINERLLRMFGGEWDLVPSLPDGWAEAPELDALRNEAQRLSSELATNGPWGWKDPRTSLTLPFWRSCIPGLKIVVCVRNPLEVAVSLNRRNNISYELGLSLWTAYARQILKGMCGAQYAVVQYERCLARPAAELARLAEFVGMPLSEEACAQAATIASARMRHSSFALHHLVESRVPAETINLYRRLSDAAARDAERQPALADTSSQVLHTTAIGTRSVPSGPTPCPAGETMSIDADRSLRRSVIELELLRRDVAEIQQSETHHRSLSVQLQRDLDERLDWVRQLEQDVAARDQRIVQLQAEQDERLEWITQLQHELDERDARVRQLQAEQDERLAWVRQLEGEIDQRDARIRELQSERDERLAQDDVVRAQLHRTVEQRDARLQELQAEDDVSREVIASLERDVEQRDELIALLRQEMGRRDELLAARRGSGSSLGGQRG